MIQCTLIWVWSVVTHSVLPLSFLTDVFEMNVAGLPDTEKHWVFSILALSMALFVKALIVIMLCKKVVQR
jgi:Mg2+ and Co2+ transporter CorA